MERKSEAVCIPDLTRADTGGFPATSNSVQLSAARNPVNCPQLRFRIFRALLNVGQIFVWFLFCFTICINILWLGNNSHSEKNGEGLSLR